MSRTLLWLTALVAVVSATVVVTRAVLMRTGPTAAQQLEEMAERLGRLEAERAAAGSPDRALARAGVQLGMAALRTARTDAPADGTPEAGAQEKQETDAHAEREARHFDRLDAVARAGGNPPAVSQLRKNIDALRARPANKGRVDLDVAAIDCGANVCRLELRRGRLGQAPDVTSAAAGLLEGMGGNLSMRPGVGERAVIYVSAPGHQLPPVES